MCCYIFCVFTFSISGFKTNFELPYKDGCRLLQYNMNSMLRRRSIKCSPTLVRFRLKTDVSRILGKTYQPNTRAMWMSNLNANTDMNKLEYAKIHWPKVSDAEKAKLKVQREENMKKAIDDFLAKHLTEQEYADHYKGKFDNVKKEVRNLLTSVSGTVFRSKNYELWKLQV